MISNRERNLEVKISSILAMGVKEHPKDPSANPIGLLRKIHLAILLIATRVPSA